MSTSQKIEQAVELVVEQLVEDICNMHEVYPDDNVMNAFTEFARTIYYYQRYEYKDLAQDLERVVKMIELKDPPTQADLQQATIILNIQRAVITLNDLIKGLTDHDYSKSGRQIGTSPITNSDPINPNHYKTQSGVECIDVAELFPYSLGNAIKYAWRAGKKDDLKQDLKKCEWYLNRAMDNGEVIYFNPLFTQEAHKAWRKFERAKHELPEANAMLLREILLGRFQQALDRLDAWITKLD